MKRWQAAALDVACVVVFVVVGRRSHAEDPVLVGAAVTAAPFLLGTAAGWGAVLAAGAAPARVWPAGVAVWGATLGVGMLLRGTVFGGGVVPSFVMVAGTFLAASLLGWRAGAGLLRRRRAAAAAG